MTRFPNQRSGIATQGLPQLLEHGFRCGSEEYVYGMVTHIERYARKSYFGLLPIGDHVEVKLWLEGARTPITLTNSMGLVGTSDGVEEVYRMLCEKTFRVRLARYLGQLGKDGYFEYGGVRFFANGDIESKGVRIGIRSAQLSLESFELLVTHSRQVRISTRVDVDVFLCLLERLYGLRFAEGAT